MGGVHLLLLLAFCFLLNPVLGKVGRGMGAKGDPRAEPFKKDIPYIACDVCRKALERAWDEAEKLRATEVRLHEDQMADMMEKVCNPQDPIGHWIAGHDIQMKMKTPKSQKAEAVQEEKGGEGGGVVDKVKGWFGSGKKDEVEKPQEKQVPKEADEDEKKTDDGKPSKKVYLVEMDGRQKCGRECETIAAACSKVLDASLLDVSEDLFKNKLKLKDLKAKYCVKGAKVCGEKHRKTPPLNYERVDEPFEALSEEELKLEDMQANMKAAGLGGTLYHRDDFQNLDMDSMNEEDFDL